MKDETAAQYSNQASTPSSGGTAERKRKEAEDLDTIAEAEHDLEMKTRFAEASAEYTARKIQLDTKLALLTHLEQYATGPDARRMIEATAEREGPNLLRAAGIYVSDSFNESIQRGWMR